MTLTLAELLKDSAYKLTGSKRGIFIPCLATR
jgi:hypothetical protein